MGILTNINDVGTRQLGGVAFTSAGLAATGGATATFATGATAISFAQDGLFKTLAQQTAQVLTAAAANTAENTARGTSGVQYFKTFLSQPTATTALYVVAISPAGTGLGVFQGGLFSNTQKVENGQSFYHNEGLLTQTQANPYPPNSTKSLVMSAFLPTLPQDVNWVPVGVIKIVNASGADFVPGTTNLNTAGLTITYTNCSYLPASANF